ncbi:cucumisin-like [Coffea arabica]|uniref:Cucumisin-like n=1 Tax=Coffea arabica TaxID=13443 RepID=A0ABM4VCL6_COFAR
MDCASLAKQSLVHSYHRSFNGFAAKLTPEEAARVSKMDGVASVFPNRIFNLQTTRSWNFMDFGTDKFGPAQEEDVIVALLDTGIWPEHESFSDANFGPPPAKWKGTCKATNFTCNKKLIGARYYNSENIYDKSDIKSPRDTIGHGTHTSSTAAGRKIEGASYLGLAEGVARGGVPNARIAMYKVCWSYGCFAADILKAFDDAIADGVDIISVSLGATGVQDYFQDPIAIGSFHAMKHGILTSNAAGNSGPNPVSVSNYSPWSLTVAASTIDRKFITQVVLGNGQVFNVSLSFKFKHGIAINNFNITGNGTYTYPLIWGGDVANYTGGYGPLYGSYCLPGAVNSEKVKGKIVFCSALVDGFGILLADGVGAILTDYASSDVAFNFPLPTSAISPEDGVKVLDYIKNTVNPLATILVADTFKDVSAPLVASFSSRGPNPISPDILKPTITAPGVDILAAWSPIAPPSVYTGDKRSLYYNVISGTSMATPHASGAAAYVKAAHPDWSPAAIKSALMTTSFSMDPRQQADLEFAYGAGHINPAGAINPGLIFEADEEDYVNFLCKQGYNSTTLKLVTGDNNTCTGIVPGRGWDLNYPTMALFLEDGQEINAVFTRTVTNVGKPSTYHSFVYLSQSTIFEVTLEPSTLLFSSAGEKKSFTVKVTGPKITQQPIMSGAVVWEDGVHEVKMPLVVYNYIPRAPYGLGDHQSTDSSAKLSGGKPNFPISSKLQKSRINALRG